MSLLVKPQSLSQGLLWLCVVCLVVLLQVGSSQTQATNSTPCSDPNFGPSCEHSMTLRFTPDFRELRGLVNIMGSANFTQYLADHSLQSTTPTEGNPVQVPCYTLFYKFSAVKGGFGWGPECYFTGAFDATIGENFRVVLGRDSDAAPGSLIPVLNHPFSGVNKDTSFIQIDSTVADSYIPVAVIDMPDEIGLCSELFVDGSSSYFPGGADLTLTYNWTLTKSDGSPVAIPSGVLDVTTVHSAILKVAEFVDAPAGEYKVTLTASIFTTNNLGTEMTTKSLVVEKIFYKRPYALPTARIAGGLQHSVPLKSAYTLFGSADLSSCYVGRDVHFTWFEKLADGSSVPLSTGSDLVVHDGVLMFPNGVNTQLQNRTFILQANSSTPSPSFNPLFSNASITIEPYLRDMQVTVGSTGTVAKQVVNVQLYKSKANAAGISNPVFSLNATVADHDDNQASKEYKWQIPAFLKPYVISGSDQTASLQLDVNGLNSDATVSQPNGAEAPLSVSVYSISSYTGVNRSASASTTLLLSKSSPAVEFVKPPSKVNADKKLVLRVLAEAPQGDSIDRYEWSVEGLNAWKQALVSGTDSTSRVLAFKPNTFGPGNTYEITVTAHTKKGASNSAVTRVLINTPPSGGSFSSIPSSGSVLDSFLFSCDNFVDPDSPLEYAFSYKIGGINSAISDKYYPLSPFSSSNYIDIPFPVPGSSGGSNLVTIQAKIRDNLKAETVVYKEITVNPISSEAELKTRILAIKESLTKASKQRDLQRIQVLVAAISKFIANSKSEYLDEASRRELRTFVASQVLFLNDLRSTESTMEVSSSDVLFQADMLQSLTGKASEVSSSTQKFSAHVLSTLTKNNAGSIDSSNAESLSQALSNLASSVSTLPVLNQARSDITKNVVESTAIITQALASRQIEGETPVSVDTDEIKIAVAKQVGSKLSSLGKIAVGRASTRVPTSGIGLSNEAEDSSVSVKMSVVKNNPYYEKGEEINKYIVGEVLSLEFSSGDSPDAIPVSHLPESILIVIPAQNNMDRIEHDLSKAGDRPQCKFWDTTNEVWSSEGCELYAYDATSTSCLCNHTTDFSSTLEYALPSVNVIGVDELNNLAKLNQDSMTTVIVMSILLSLYILALVGIEIINCCCFGLNRLMKTRKPKSEHQLRGYIRPLIDKLLSSHIWFSVIWVPYSQSNFTRSMRITVLMIIILGSMGSNALTFGQQQANAVQTILAAFLGDLLVTPFVLGFTFLFLKVSPNNKSFFNRLKGKSVNPESIDVYAADDDSNGSASLKEMPRKQQQTAFTDPTEQKVVASSPRSNQEAPLDDTGSPNDDDEPAARFSPKELLFDKIDIVLGAVYKRYKYFADNSVIYGLAVFGLSTLFYFAVVSLGSIAIATSAKWLGTIGIMVFCCLSTILYFAFLEMIYLNTKVKRFRTTSMAWKGKITSRVGIALGIGLLSVLSAFIIGCVFFMKQVNPAGYNWEFIFVIQLALFGLMVLIIIWMGFLYVSPKKKPKKGAKQKTSFLKRPWFPNFIKYPIYLLAWSWMAAMSFILVVYGVNFDIKYGSGTSLKWLAASSGSQAQNIFLNKPLMFLIRFVVLTAIIKMFEFLFFRSQYVTEVDDNDTGSVSEEDDAPLDMQASARRERRRKRRHRQKINSTSTPTQDASSTTSSEDQIPPRSGVLHGVDEDNLSTPSTPVAEVRSR